MKIGFIGVGNMAQAMIKGFVRNAAIAPADILVHSAHKTTYEPFAQQFDLTAVASNEAVVAGADVVFLAVKPQIIPLVLAETKMAIAQQSPIVVSMAAGVSLTELTTETSTKAALMRIMPNVNVANGAGITALVGNEQVTEAQQSTVQQLLQILGGVVLIPEADFTTFSALAGSSPAFVYLFIDAMSRAGVKHGLKKTVATQIAAQAVLGSAQTVLAGEHSPWDLIDQVSSPGGTTVAGLLAMEDAGLMTAVVKGIDATIAKDLENQA